MLTSLCSLFPATGKKVVMETPDVNYQYTHSWLATRGVYLEFEVMACNDAHLLLTQVPGDTNSNSVEVVIGGYRNARYGIEVEKLINILPLFC